MEVIMSGYVMVGLLNELYLFRYGMPAGTSGMPEFQSLSLAKVLWAIHVQYTQII